MYIMNSDNPPQIPGYTYLGYYSLILQHGGHITCTSALHHIYQKNYDTTTYRLGVEIIDTKPVPTLFPATPFMDHHDNQIFNS